jgi:hypothetical protein
MKVVMVDDSPANRKLCRFLPEDALEPRFIDACESVEPHGGQLGYRLPDMTSLEFLPTGPNRPHGAAFQVSFP